VRKLIACLLAITLIGALSISLTGCGGGKTTPKAPAASTPKTN
jgi:hypothetical protein